MSRAVVRRVTKKQDKDKTSNFLLTIVTNQRSKPNSEDEIKFDKYLRGLLDEPTRFLKDLDGKSINDARYYPYPVSVEYGIEYNALYSNLHCHCIVMLKHRSRCQINVSRIKAEVFEVMGSNPIVKSNYVKDPHQAMLKYIGKQQSD